MTEQSGVHAAVRPGKRIGILGGTFDPPHEGHLAIARAAISQLELDEIIFMPVARNPLKRKPIATGKQRLAMTKLLLEDEPKVAISDLELSRGGKSYAVDTL
ncbi:MAG: nicotinate-nucleotide adenylyltransferase, partial [Fimbriimonadaceae bacterium]|nr:nicotinate-nucleotide adenylyltransferase [Fimbriimonadaceae bacterium]